MRIAFVSVSDQMGGSEVVLLEILRGLAAQRASWRTHLVVPGDGPLTQASRACGADVAVVPMPPALARFGETAAMGGGGAALPSRLIRTAASIPAYQGVLNAALARIGPDVVHTNGFKAHVFAARMRGAHALVWHVHEYISPRPMTSKLLRRYARRSDAIVANSNSVASDVRHVLGGRPVRTIANGVDVERFSPYDPRADLDALSELAPAPAGTVRVGLVATFARWKGHATFLQALAAVPRDLPIRGYIVGGPVYDTRGSQYSVDELRTLADTLGLEDRIGFTGFVPAAADALRALDVVVHASTAPEPFGMVIAEAMACGRAVVTSGEGGAAELVADGRDAVIHRPGDAGDLAARIVTLVSDPATRDRVGAAARTSARSRFDARRMTEQFAHLYQETADRRRVTT